MTREAFSDAELEQQQEVIRGELDRIGITQQGTSAEDAITQRRYALLLAKYDVNALVLEAARATAGWFDSQQVLMEQIGDGNLLSEFPGVVQRMREEREIVAEVARIITADEDPKLALRVESREGICQVRWELSERNPNGMWYIRHYPPSKTELSGTGSTLAHIIEIEKELRTTKEVTRAALEFQIGAGLLFGPAVTPYLFIDGIDRGPVFTTRRTTLSGFYFDYPVSVHTKTIARMNTILSTGNIRFASAH